MVVRSGVVSAVMVRANSLFRPSYSRVSSRPVSSAMASNDERASSGFGRRSILPSRSSLVRIAATVVGAIPVLLAIVLGPMPDRPDAPSIRESAKHDE